MVLRLALLVLALLPATAHARTEAGVPLSTHFKGLAVAPTGQAWVSAEEGRTGLWGPVGPDGRPQWRAHPTGDGFVGLLSARSDGGAWLLADRRTALRLAPDGGAAAFGPLDVPFAEDDRFEVLGATATDGSFVLTGKLGRLLRVAQDGTVAAQRVALPRVRRGCFAVDMAAGPAGTVTVVDYRCRRLLTFTPSGEVSVIDLRSRRGEGWRFPTGVLPRPGGGFWFTARTIKGNDIRTVLGRADRRGARGQRQIPWSSELAAAPGGALWAPGSGECAVYRLRPGRVRRVPAPFPVRRIAFGPDGGAWLQGWSRLIHLSERELLAAGPPTHCDTRYPRIRFRDETVRHEPFYTRLLSIATLRREGLRFTSSERATLSGNFMFDGVPVYAHEVIRHAGGGATIPIPEEVLVAGDEVYMHAELRDASGNGVISSYPFTLVP
jgi:hypothetical protein